MYDKRVNAGSTRPLSRPVSIAPESSSESNGLGRRRRKNIAGLGSFRAQQRARHAAEREERRLADFRQEQRKAARREREKPRERNEKGEKLARHVQRYLE
jgi:hypothetical protein